MSNVAWIIVGAMGLALFGCTVSQRAFEIAGPPRYESLASQRHPRIVSFRRSLEEPYRLGLWFGTEGSGSQSMGIIQPLAKQELPSDQDWQEYRKEVAQYQDYAPNSQKPSELVKLPISQMLKEGLLGVPFAPARIIGVAMNHNEHMKDLGFSLKDIEEFKQDPPRFFWKKTEAIGPFDPIRRPQKKSAEAFRVDEVYLDYEVELGLVVGKTLKAGDITEDTDLSDVLAGIVLANDVSDREPQIWAISHPEDPDEGTTHWPLTGKKKRWTRHAFDLFVEGKSHPTFAVLGPFLISPENYGALYDKGLELWRRDFHDGGYERKQNGLVMHYLHSPQRILAAALEDPYLNLKELRPGDVILMGTPAGTILKGSDLQKLMPKELVYHAYFAATFGMRYLIPGNHVWAETSLLGFQSNPILGPN